MMRSVLLIVQFDFIVAHGVDRPDRLSEKLEGLLNSSFLLDRSLPASPRHRADLDSTTFGKPGSLAVPATQSPSRSALPSSHRLASRVPHRHPLAGRFRPVSSLANVRGAGQNAWAASQDVQSTPYVYDGRFALPYDVQPASYIYDGRHARSQPRGNAATRAVAGIAQAEDISDAAFKHLDMETQLKEQLEQMRAEALGGASAEAAGGKPAAMAEAAESLPKEDGLVHELHSEEDLDTCLVQSPGLVVLEIVTSWCRVCRNFVPKYKRLAGHYEEVKFVKLVGNENESTNKVAMERFKITKTPYFVFYRDGEIFARQSGTNLNDLRSILDTA
jgi:thiol-disulfide isomerase/thioredoxin